MSQRNVLVVDSINGDRKEVSVGPGTTASDILQHLGHDPSHALLSADGTGLASGDIVPSDTGRLIVSRRNNKGAKAAA